MKRIGLILVAVMLCVSVCFAQQPRISQRDFVIDMDRVGRYLELTLFQKEEMKEINQHFKQQQQRSARYDGERRTRYKQKAVLENLVLVKEVLTIEQYRKYLTLMNLTNAAYLEKEMKELPEIYLAKEL